MSSKELQEKSYHDSKSANNNNNKSDQESIVKISIEKTKTTSISSNNFSPDSFLHSTWKPPFHNQAFSFPSTNNNSSHYQNIHSNIPHHNLVNPSNAACEQIINSITPSITTTNNSRYSSRRKSSIETIPIDHPTNWHKDAIVYEIYLRGFFDANGDGIGDFQGLIMKLDYLHWLGVNCIWLLPVFESPLKDGGYDISDYYNVLPEYGNVDDFRIFLNESHKRGMRVICDLVVNHTSDQHIWFKESASSKDNPKRDWYVWSDNDQKYKDARIIFVDTEKSNWTWHEPTKQFYWHRFFSHQPDLNYENPEVQQAILDVMDFWFEFGVDGFRIDAAPYLFEEEGTNCENLQRTHEYLRKMRKHVDEHFPGRILLAEANQWPSDVVSYFGQGEGDECHMAYHFPIMPRLFIALRQRDRLPIIEVLKNTPDIPKNCAWGIFLRNHDELTLEMCSNEERDYLYHEYAKVDRMRLNIGIRRRLAPLMENSRREIELMKALLFGLPGTPFLYYGDEIGMGDNIYLGDRDGVRTPMQWSTDRNGGFSRCDFAQLYFPVNMDTVFGYLSVNVEAQIRHPSSLLMWTRNMIQHRKRYSVFGHGSISFLHPSNRKVLAFIRSDKDNVCLCVYNLSPAVQPVELDLSEYVHCTPVDMLDGVVFPEVKKDQPYQLALSGLGWYWFHLKSQVSDGSTLVIRSYEASERPRANSVIFESTHPPLAVIPPPR